jgi:hypothetical protein
MFGHECSIYFPKDPEKGDKFTCMCGVSYVCVRLFPWTKWNCLGREELPRPEEAPNEPK